MKNLHYIVLASMIITSCTMDDEPTIGITPENIDLDITYFDSFDNTIYPSLIVGLSGNDIDFFTINMVNESSMPQTVTITIESNAVIEQTVMTELLTSGTNVIQFSPNWDYTNMIDLDQSGSVNFRYTISQNGETITTDNQTMSYRSISECVYVYYDEETQSFVDVSYNFAAYVNEDNPSIDELLGDALDDGIVSQYKGYQGSEQEVVDEVFSLWYHMQSLGVKYSSITNTSNPSQQVWSQNVRFFDDVLSNGQANCVDGSAFLSSILLKVGIDPFLVLVPGHMYMGFYAKPNQSAPYLIETTRIGVVDITSIVAGDLQRFADQGYFTNDQIQYYNQTGDLDFMVKVISLNEFYLALNDRIEDYNGYTDKLNDPSELQYQFMDIKDLRSTVRPINR